MEHNGTANVITLGSNTWQPGELDIHDGAGGQFGVLRFTAPTAGTYAFVGSFIPGDTFANNTVYLLDNGTSVFSGTRTGNGTTGFSVIETLNQGDTLDFAVGGQYVAGDTGLQATITRSNPVPEASSFVSLGLLLCLGLGSMAISQRRRAQAAR